MGLRELISRTTMANIVAAIVIVAAVFYAAYVGDRELLRNIAYIAAGYLLGVGGRSAADRRAS